jgi:hypothetical protein
MCQNALAFLHARLMLAMLLHHKEFNNYTIRLTPMDEEAKLVIKFFNRVIIPNKGLNIDIFTLICLLKFERLS